jgi:hypothetical protein
MYACIDGEYLYRTSVHKLNNDSILIYFMFRGYGHQYVQRQLSAISN